MKEREKKSPTLGIFSQGGQCGRSLSVVSYEQLGSGADVIEANMECARMNVWDLHKNVNKVKASYVQARENSSDSQQYKS